MTHYRAEAPSARRAVLVLAHGAGAGERHPFMVGMGRGLAARGIDVVTFDFPYMRQKRRVPDKAPVLEAAFREAVAEALAGDAPDHRSPQLFIGGKSMGGRMATHLAAQGLEGLRGVVVLGYPLHPPGRPDRPRVTHLPGIRVPMLVVQGERDPFGTPDELRPVVDALPARVALHVVAGGDHSLNVRKSSGPSQDAVRATVLDTIAAWIHSA
ncbi:MAG: alpha/beta fold hydrolase [Vicinamibacterales bacterium]